MRASRAACLALVSVPFFYQLGLWPLIEPDEGRNAEIAREMLASGGWSLPHFNGLPFLDKPPALFWMIAASFRALGASEWAARLPSALAACVLVALTYSIGRMLAGRRAALLAAVVLATSPIVLIFARLTIFDMPFTALVTVAIWCLLHARLDGKPAIWLPAAGLAVGLATLTKGPVGIAVPLLAWMAGRGALPAPRQHSNQWTRVATLLAFVLVVGPWLVLVSHHEPGFLRYALLDETLLRFTSSARFHRGGPIYYHVVGLVLGFGVWTIVLAAMAPSLVRRRAAETSEAATIRFLARTSAAILLLFSICASKRPGYILPAMVPLSLLLAIGIEGRAWRVTNVVRRVTVVLVLAGSALAVAAVWIPSLWLDRAVARPVAVAMAATFTAWGLGTRLLLQRRPRMAFGAAAVLAPGLYVMLLGPLAGYAEARSARTLARDIAPETDVMALGTFRTSLPFYLRRSVVLASSTGRELTSNYVASGRDRFFANGSLWRPRALRRRLDAGGEGCVLVSRNATWRLIAWTPHPLRIMASDRRSLVVCSSGEPAAGPRFSQAETPR